VKPATPAAAIAAADIFSLDSEKSAEKGLRVVKVL
jgi:hypothetical protein